MRTVNLDDDLAPLLTVRVNGKEYQVVDISPRLAQDMSTVGVGEGKIGELHRILAEVIGAPVEEVANLGLRKTRLLMDGIFTAIEEEAEEVRETAKKGRGAGAGKSS